ncbi:cyd operon YbgE family protein [Ectopseudomonas khazarica]|uniref:cyd operon YbgE family protein n=1 Tax=Ectopseudomonas khazarica TaxID=2502979 RepID=UPI001AEF6D0D|nr:cyd operon YbgE family protein [Pseudomonas khazarica]QTS88663.1 cyd operon YbgE family protein [Pseudomonas khazarica]
MSELALSERAPLRALSWLLAMPMALVLLIHPGAMLDSQGGYSHSLLMLVMWGVSCAFIHGVGFTPRLRLWRTLFSPWLGWGLCGLGYALLGLAQAT